MNELPKDTFDMYTRLYLSTGRSAATLAAWRKEGTFAPNLRVKFKNQFIKDGQAWDLHSNDVCIGLRSLFAGNTYHRQLTASLIEQMQRHQEFVAGKKPSKYVNRDLGTIELITGLCSFLPPVFESLSTD